LCGSCLWYAESGERLCEEDAAVWRAAGRTVHAPERYAEGIAHSEASAAAPPIDAAPYRGNSTDVGALLAAVAGLLSLGQCFGLAYVMPLLAFGLGLVGWLQAKDSIDPARTRLLSGVGMATGGVFVLAGLAVLTLCLMCFVLSLAIPSNRGTVFSTPLPPTFPTPTPFAFATPSP
jgi:hypothetical protein